MIYWAPLLHFYQPPLQLQAVLKKVCDESYRPLMELFRQHPLAKVTVNICGVLTEMLWEHGFGDVIDSLKTLAEAGQVEFTGSAKYHAILPLIPEDERKRQIRRNHLANRHFFGEVYSPKGFFPPELCYSEDILEAVVESRHQWILLSGVACPVSWPMDVIHQIAYDDWGLAVFFRDDILSNKISFQGIDGKGFIQHLKGLKGEKSDMYVVTAMDAETFGHHIQNWEKLFLAEVYEALGPAMATYQGIQQRQPLAEQHRDLLAFQEKAEAKEIEVVTMSELLGLFPAGSKVKPKPSSWSTSDDDIKVGNPYPLWKGINNRVHELQWEHVDIAIDIVRKAEAVADSEPSRNFAAIARGLLDRALHSCQFWWASKRPMWDINMVDRGLMQQQRAIFNAYKAIEVSSATKTIKREYYYKVLVSRGLANKLHDYLLFD